MKQYVATIEATHGGFINGNNTWYLENDMEDGVDSWITPYKKPVLPHHDKKKDSLGYVFESKYISTTDASGSNEPQGHIELKAVISDMDAVQKIKDGRYRTVSISADAKYAKCSICDHVISQDGLCEHKRGNMYDGKKCYWEIGELNYKEVSPVNMPADEFASITKLEELEVEDMVFTDSVDNSNTNKLKFSFESSDDTQTDNSVETTKDDKQSNGETMDEKEKELQDLKVQLSGMLALDEKVKAQDAKIETLEKEKTVVTDSLAAAEATNEELRGVVHANCVDKVYDLRKNLQRKDVMGLKDDKEVDEYKASLAKRSDESLTDTISDLQTEEPLLVVDEVIDGSDGDETVDDKEKPAAEVKDNIAETKQDRVARILSSTLNNSEED